MKPIFLAINLILIFLLGCSPVQTVAQITPTSKIYTATSTVTLTETSTFVPTDTKTSAPTSTYTPIPTPVENFKFALTSDMVGHAGPGEFDTPQFFRGACETISQLGKTDFMISVGDISPAKDTYWTVKQYLGEDYLWFPMVGNHDLYPGDMNFLRTYNYDPNGDAPPNIVKTGPPDCEETTISFDYLNSHFVVLNVYCDTSSDIRTDGAIVDALYNWLKEDLSATDKEHIFVLGHEPAYPQPDTDTGLLRHLGDSLDKYPITRDRFWDLLKEYNVTAYITAHTHAYSVVDIDGVWQVDIGHTRGAHTQATPSTFLIIEVDGSWVTYYAYRTNNMDRYILRHSGVLN